MTCTCFKVPTSGPETCGWCGIYPKAAPIAAAPASLAARLAPALADAATFTRLADSATTVKAETTLRWFARQASDSARLTAQRWAIGA